MREVNQNEEMLKKNFSELTELKHILRKTQQFFEEVCFYTFFSSQIVFSALIFSFKIQEANQLNQIFSFCQYFFKFVVHFVEKRTPASGIGYPI